MTTQFREGNIKQRRGGNSRELNVYSMDKKALIEKAKGKARF